MSEQPENPIIKIISCDNREFFVSQRVAFMSELIKQLFVSNPEASNEITVPDITGDILSRVVDFCISELLKVTM